MVKIREALFKDFEGIELLKSRYGLDAKGYDEWRHIWENDIVRNRIKKSLPTGWVLQSDEDKIVGYLGNIPLIYELNGSYLTAAAATTFVVDADHRNHSIMLAKSFFAQEGVDILLITTANYEAGRIFQAFGARRMPVETYDTPLFWITDYRMFISSSFVKKHLPLKHLVTYPLAFALCGADKLFNKICLNKGMADVEIKLRSGFDKCFDVFWQALKERCRNRLMQVRDQESLERHFKYAVADKRVAILTFEKNFRMIGYAIFMRQDNPVIGLKRMRLVDLQYIERDSDTTKAAVSFAIRMCCEKGVHVLEALGYNKEKRESLEMCCPHKRRLPNWPFFYKANNGMLAKALEDPEVWDPSPFDGDSSI